MIEQPYLLLVMIPCYQDDEGRRFVDELWHKDLMEHLVQIRDLRLACPLRRDFPAGKLVEIDDSAYPGKLSFVDLPACTSTLKTLKAMPAIFSRIWKAVGEAKVVHTGPGGWPISPGWFAIPMARLRGKFALTNVESAAWRLGFQPPRRLKGVLTASVFEALGRVMVNLSDLATFTHAGYREEMLIPPRRHRGHVISASWINLGNILDRAEARADWESKLADAGRPLRVVFAAHLNVNKGMHVLLDAARELDRRGVRIDLDVYGKGTLQERCEAVAAELKGSVKLSLKGMLDYGDGFFRMLQTHDVMLVPSVTDEQPRIIYDSFARALPVIASATPGNLECVTDGVNGKIVPVGDAMALADALEWAAGHRLELSELGVNGLTVAASLTHDQMHAKRADLIKSALGQATLSPA